MTLDAARACHPGARTFRFGDGPALNAEILALVRSGAKTESCDAAAAFARRGEPLPSPGRTDIALTGDGAPACAIRTIAVDRMPFDAMTEDRVAAQGEFRDLAHWRAGYTAYLRRAGLFAPDLEMVVETFELVETFERMDDDA